jgi:hypothetical protein
MAASSAKLKICAVQSSWNLRLQMAHEALLLQALLAPIRNRHQSSSH